MTPVGDAPRRRVRALLEAVEPFDEREEADRRWALDWVDSGAPLFRTAKPATRRHGTTREQGGEVEVRHELTEGPLDQLQRHAPLKSVARRKVGLRFLYRVTGSLTHPLPEAARVATPLEEHDAFLLVHAAASDRWAFIARRRPDLLADLNSTTDSSMRA